MSIAGPLKIEGSKGSQTIYETKGQIDEGFKDATVLESTPESIWVIYNVPNWDHELGSNLSQVVEYSQPESLTPIRSAQGFDKNNPGIILFEHSKFRGYGNKLSRTTPDLTSSFPQGKVAGVSSAIVTGGIWQMRTGYNGTGTLLTINGQSDLGPGRYDFGSLPVNDEAKSLLYIRPSN